MNIYKKVFGALIVFEALIHPAFARATSYSEAKAMADRDESTVPAIKAKELIKSENELSLSLLQQCEKEKKSQDFRSFVVVAEIDVTGKVLNTWRKGDSYLAICLEKKIKDVSLFVPPYAPFYTSVEMTIDYKGVLDKNDNVLSN